MADKKSKPLSGAIFENKKKVEEKHPDFQGTYTDANGVEFWVSAWKHSHATAGKYLSFEMKPKQSVDAIPNKAVAGW